MTMGLYVDNVALPEAEFNREPYLVAITVTGNGAPDGRDEIEIRTEPAKGIKKGKPLVFDPPLALCPAADVGGRIVSKVVVMESDSDFRRIGDRLDHLREKIAATGLGRRLLAGLGIPSTGLALAGLREVSELAMGRLKKAGDDVLAEIEIVLDESEANCRLGHHWDEVGKKATIGVRAAHSDRDFDTVEWTPERKAELAAKALEADAEAESEGGEEPDGQEEEPDGQDATPWEASVSDLVQWESGGALQKPKKVTRIEDGFAFFRGSKTGVPVAELLQADEEEA